MLQGNSSAWQEFFEMYGQPLFIYAFHRSSWNATLADDIRQETLLAAIEAIKDWRGEGPLFGWLCGIARHKIADMFDDQHREAPGLEPLAWTEEKKLLSQWLFSENEPLPEEIVDRAETNMLIIEALWSLPADYRTALLSRYVWEETVKKTAGRLGRSYKATESLLSRAREALRQSLKEMIRDDG